MTAPGRIPGNDERPERRAIGEALRLHHTARRGPPSADDAPPPSTFPMTKAARAALALEREAAKRRPR